MNNYNFENLAKLLQTNTLWCQNKDIQFLNALFDKKELTKEEKSNKADYKKLLKNTSFFIAGSGYNWDQWRLPIDCAVIHHTSSTPTISLRELNILGLRLYINQYLKDEDVKNQPIYSGHYWYGKPHNVKNMTFVSYHYLVRPNGSTTQLVDDSAYLWHAGNLEINRKSISIAIAGKYIDKEPSEQALDAVSKIIKGHKITKENVFGHMEVVKKDLLGESVSPGKTFLSRWKKDLLSRL